MTCLINQYSSKCSNPRSTKIGINSTPPAGPALSLINFLPHTKGSIPWATTMLKQLKQLRPRPSIAYHRKHKPKIHAKQFNQLSVFGSRRWDSIKSGFTMPAPTPGAKKPVPTTTPIAANIVSSISYNAISVICWT